MLSLIGKLGYVSLGFFITGLVTTAFAAWNTPVTTGSALTATIWNDLVTQVQSISTTVSGLGTFATKSTATSADITDGTIADADISNTAAIANTKIAGLGSLATKSAVATADITDSTIANADISATAAIAGTKVSPNFGSQNVVTTGLMSALDPVGDSDLSTKLYVDQQTAVVGIDVNNPKIAASAATCNASNEGRIRYVTATKALEICNATSWTTVLAGTPAFTCGTSTVTDASGNSYATVLIGTQCWLKSNLHTILKPGGAVIAKGPATHGGGGWTTDAGYYSCPPNSTNNGEDCAAASDLGMLYQWSAAMNGSTTAGSQGICPTGWHLPTDAQWETLEENLAGSACRSGDGWQCDPVGSKLGANTGSASWLAYAGGLFDGPGFDASGFDAPATGYRITDSSYNGRTYASYLWSSTESAGSAYVRHLHYSMSELRRDMDVKADGFSVRCLMD